MKLASLWQGWISAVQFLTVIPCAGRNHIFDAGRALPFFPLCGLMLGGVVALVDAAASTLWMPPASSLLAVLALIILTGALHLDGVADTADGLYGRREPEKALAIMKDSRIGAIGAVVMVCCLAVKWIGISGISADRALWLVLVPAYARASVLFGIKLMPYGRPDGTGSSFFHEPIQWQNFWGLALIIGLSLIAGRRMILINLGFAVIVIGILSYYRKKIGCITGDMLGAMIETMEAILFFILSAGDIGG